MQRTVKFLLGGGLFLLLGTPLITLTMVFLQAPRDGEHATVGQSVAKVLIANFASLPFMLIGLILIIVALVKNRRRLP